MKSAATSGTFGELQSRHSLVRGPTFICDSPPRIICDSAPKFICDSVPTFRCDQAPMLTCEGDSSFKCSGVPSFSCDSAPVFRCDGPPRVICEGTTVIAGFDSVLRDGQYSHNDCWSVVKGEGKEEMIECEGKAKTDPTLQITVLDENQSSSDSVPCKIAIDENPGHLEKHVAETLELKSDASIIRTDCKLENRSDNLFKNSAIQEKIASKSEVSDSINPITSDCKLVMNSAAKPTALSKGKSDDFDDEDWEFIPSAARK